MKMKARKGFITEEKKVETMSYHQTWSVLLRNAVSAKRTGKSLKWKLSDWCLEFAKLEKSLNYDRNRVLVTLEWFCENINKEYIPVVLSAKSFREKFEQIEDAMSRRGGKVKELTRPAKQVIAKLSNLKWNQTQLTQLEEAVQLSLDAYNKFYNHVSIKIGKYMDKDDNFRLNNKLVNFPDKVKTVLYDPVTFIYNWFDSIYYKTRNPAWHGPLSEIFSPKAERFTRLMETVASNYGNPTLWNEMVRQLRIEGVSDN